ncbi:MAG: hypothetical protein WKF86_00120 [Acidimicrobiales bacterium]
MATLDVLTAEQAQAALKGVKGLGDLNRIAGLVSAVSKVLDERWGAIVARTALETPPSARGPRVLRGRVFDPATLAITEAWSSEAPVAAAATRYVVDTDGPFSQVSAWAGYWAPRVSVSYSAGRYATTAAVAEPFITAAGMLLQHHWRRSDGGGSDTYGPPLGLLDSGLPSFGFPHAVRDLLAGELLPPAVA